MGDASSLPLPSSVWTNSRPSVSHCKEDILSLPQDGHSSASHLTANHGERRAGVVVFLIYVLYSGRKQRPVLAKFITIVKGSQLWWDGKCVGEGQNKRKIKFPNRAVQTRK